MTTKYLSAPNYRLHKPSGRAVVTLKDKDYYLGPYGSLESQQAYNRLLAQYYQHGRNLPSLEAYTIGHLTCPRH